MVDPLTERERRILGYLAGALSSAEIAAELYVSTSTVLASQHVLYRKLGTASRRAAVLRATELRLL